MSERRIKVLVAEDSEVTRMFLVHLLESDPAIEVVAAVADGQAALDFIAGNRPDAVLMDIHMPRMDGFEATRRIMESYPLPIVICSAVADVRESVTAFRAMEAGAIACIEKPLGRASLDFEATAQQLLDTVKLMAEVKVVRRTPRPGPPPRLAGAPASSPLNGDVAGIRMVGIGASTGGPPVIQSILAELPKEFPVPVLVVQHIAQGFTAGMANWLNQTTGLHVQVAAYGTIPLAGHVYLAPDDMHMGLAIGGGIVLTRQAPENHLRPAVSFLFRSMAQVYGARALGVLLTGMGRDGAAELKLLRDRGAITIAQDRESSVVHGMPGAAIALGGASQVLPAGEIAQALIAMVRRREPVEGRRT